MRQSHYLCLEFEILERFIRLVKQMATSWSVGNDTAVFYPERVIILIWFPALKCFTVKHGDPTLFWFMILIVVIRQ